MCHLTHFGRKEVSFWLQHPSRILRMEGHPSSCWQAIAEKSKNSAAFLGEVVPWLLFQECSEHVSFGCGVRCRSTQVPCRIVNDTTIYTNYCN